MKTWKVTENNGGGLTLNVWDNESLVYLHTGYEYDATHSQLRNDISLLYDDDNYDMDNWDGNEADEYDYDDHPTTRIIAAGDEEKYTIYPNMMGAAGRSALARLAD